MSRRKKRPRADIAAAVRRLTSEKLVPLSELVTAAGVQELSLRRFVIDGTPTPAGRIYLDGFHRPSIGWLSSLAALNRFQKARAAVAGTTGGQNT